MSKKNDNIEKKKTSNSASETVEISEVSIISHSGEPIESIISDGFLRIQFSLKVNTEITKPEIVVGTHTTDFVYLTASTTELTKSPLQKLTVGEHRITLEHKSYPLKPGVYGIRISIFDQNRNNLYSAENLHFFTVTKSSDESKEPALRLLSIESNWSINNQSI